MNYDEINVEKTINEVSTAVVKWNYRKATKKDSMEIRLAALALLVKIMQYEMTTLFKMKKSWYTLDMSYAAWIEIAIPKSF